MADEEELRGGNVSVEVVRVGQTVRRPAGPWTPTVHAVLRHLEAAGFDGAPRVLGLDERGREVIEFLEGVVPWPEKHRSLLGSDDAVRRVGLLLRTFHDAIAGFDPGPEAVWRYPEMAADATAYVDHRGLIVCHNDPTAWNLVVGPDRWAFIDWDAAGIRPPIWDVAYCAIGIVPIDPNTAQAGWHATVPVTARLRALADGYGLDAADLRRLPEVIVARIRSSYEHMRRRALAGLAPWDALWRNRHGEAWAARLTFAEARAPLWATDLAAG